MVGVNSFQHHFGIVAIFATLFAAIQVKGDKGCVFDLEHTSDFNLECNDVKNSWVVSEDLKDSLKKKVLSLTPEQDGCLKTKNTITLNSTSPVSFRFYREVGKDDGGKFVMRLVPKEGSCPDDTCVWDIASDPQYKAGEWVTADYKFPLKSMNEYYVQVQVDKTKGKFLADRISLPSAFGDSSRCQLSERSVKPSSEAEVENINLPSRLVATDANGTSFSPSFAEISKNLMITSASGLIINNLLN